MGEHDRGTEPSLPETEERERQTEGEVDDAASGSLAAAERQARASQEDAETDAGAPSLPATEHRTREAAGAADADREGGTPSLSGTERRTREREG